MDIAVVGLAVVGGFLLLVFLWFIVIYNRFVTLRNQIAEAWSDIDTELKRRYDLIPNLVSVVKGYAAHEQTVFESVARARAQAAAASGGAGAFAQHQNELTRGLRQLFAVAEGYPQLKADRHFLELQEELTNTEDRIQAARRFFNGNIREFNVLADSFPSNLIAQTFGFTRKEFFELDDLQARQPPAVEFRA
jgi:LemA protein